MVSLVSLMRNATPIFIGGYQKPPLSFFYFDAAGRALPKESPLRGEKMAQEVSLMRRIIPSGLSNYLLLLPLCHFLRTHIYPSAQSSWIASQGGLCHGYENIKSSINNDNISKGNAMRAFVIISIIFMISRAYMSLCYQHHPDIFLIPSPYFIPPNTHR